MPSLLSGVLFKNKKKCENIFAPPRWLAKLRQKSVLSTANFSIQEPINYDKEIDLFEKSYLLATEELNYAIESQGSIYYQGDLLATEEAVHHCLDQFHDLLRLLQPRSAQYLQHRWSEALYQLQSRLSSLPVADAESH
ncbi:hypothetical protein G6F56_011050 [Rhizopus delemar]|nr:hypothetical protein G6F56_011050 [Rhizopus delemar]